jgi:lipopolysaccharide export system permease protein
LKKIVNLTIISFVGPFVATFFIVLFTLLMQFLWMYVDDMVGKGLEWYVIGELLFFASASFVPLALPLAVLLSSIMAFGKMAETYELVALKSAGVSLIRIMLPMITVTFAFAIGGFFFSNNVIPVANLKFQSLLWDIRQQRPALDIKQGVFFGGIDNYSIKIDKKDKASQHIEGVTIYDHTRDNGDAIIITAKSGEMLTTEDKRWLILKLYNGTRYEEMDPNPKGPPSWPANRLNFKSYEIHFDLSQFNLSRTKEALFKDNHQMLNISQLQYYEDSTTRLRIKKAYDDHFFEAPYFAILRDTARSRFAKPKPAAPTAQTIPVVKKDSAKLLAGAKHKQKNKKAADTVKQAKLKPSIPKPLIPVKLAPDKLIVQNFPISDRRDMISRALNMAHTLKDVAHSQAEELKTYDELITSYRIEWQRKFSLSLACLTLFFIGAPLGAIIRKGGIGMPTVVALIMFIIFYVISVVGEKSAKEGAISPFLGMWISTLVLLPIGLYLTYRANIDSINFNFDRISLFFQSMGKIFKAKPKNADTPAM